MTHSTCILERFTRSHAADHLNAPRVGKHTHHYAARDHHLHAPYKRKHQDHHADSLNPPRVGEHDHRTAAVVNVPARASDFQNPQEYMAAVDAM